MTTFEEFAQRGGSIDNPAAYAQTALVRTFLSARRTRSSGELPAWLRP